LEWCSGLRKVSTSKELGKVAWELTLETRFDYVERMSCKSRGYASGKAGNCLNQRRGETRMVVVHRVMRWACFFLHMMEKADGEV
jgi:hypothetical protein